VTTPRNENTILRRAASLAALASVAALIAGCGSSSSSSTITVGNENSQDNKLITQTAPTQTTSTTAAAGAVKTPTSGALSQKPVVTANCPSPVSKLETKELITGTGAEAKKGSAVTVNYVGVLCKDGKEFDSSWKRNEPFSFTIGTGSVIKGWEEGVIGMKVGGRRELIIPAEEAYGAKGSGSTIPPNEPIVFVVDLLKA
jgi:peptidylprolyl isomerase